MDARTRAACCVAMWAWPWVVIELANGIVHPAMALLSREYFPGVVTAPVLLVLA